MVQNNAKIWGKMVDSLILNFDGTLQASFSDVIIFISLSHYLWFILKSYINISILNNLLSFIFYQNIILGEKKNTSSFVAYFGSIAVLLYH